MEIYIYRNNKKRDFFYFFLLLQKHAENFNCGSGEGNPLKSASTIFLFDKEQPRKKLSKIAILFFKIPFGIS